MSPRSGGNSPAAISLGALAILFAAAVLAIGTLSAPYKGYPEESAEVLIPRGASPAQVARILQDAGVIRSPILFRLQTRFSGSSELLQAGEYRFSVRLTPGEVLHRIVSGDVILHRLTIPEGLTGREAIQRVARMGLAEEEDLLAAFANPEAMRDLDPEASDLEGYLFPETYYFARPAPARKILGEMVSRFRAEFTAALRERAEERRMTLRGVVTMASLIEKETSIPEERRRVSAVFHNRLRRGMSLQCDPTVIYALASDGLYRGTLTRDDLAYASPYNTYLNPGLPPGPIAAPGLAALEAALDPAEVPDLYFVADGSGGHHFSRSLQEHQRAVERFKRLRKQGA
jgi:UPF0755 protein